MKMKIVTLFDNNHPTNDIDIIITDARTETAPQLAVKTQLWIMVC